MVYTDILPYNAPYKMSGSLTVDDIIASKTRHGDSANLLSLDPSRVSSSGKDKTPTKYIGLKFKKADGNDVSLFLSVFNQLCNGAGAYLENNVIKNTNISYRAFETQDVNNTDYAPEHRAKLLKNNAAMIQALDILADEYEKLAARINNKEFKSITGKVQSPKIFNMRQTTVDVKENGEDVEKTLDHPMYRIKLKFDANTQEYGYTDRDSGKFQYTLFDGRKKLPDGGREPAKIIHKGVKCPVTAKFIGNFITRYSLTAGSVRFNVCLSKMGISLQANYSDIYVLPHRKIKYGTDKTKVDEMDEFMTGVNVDDIEINTQEGQTGDADADQDDNQSTSKAIDRTTSTMNIQEPVIQDDDVNMAEPEDQDDQDEEQEDSEHETQEAHEAQEVDEPVDDTVVVDVVEEVVSVPKKTKQGKKTRV